MANKKVVPGSLTRPYLQNKGDFARNLPARDITDGTALLTNANFVLTTSIQRRLSKFYKGNDYLGFFDLESIGLTQEQSKKLVNRENKSRLNLDKTKIERHVYFGSFVEFLRVSVEDIITNWYGSLFINRESPTTFKNTVLDYSYDQASQKSTFRIPTSTVDNKYNLTYSFNNIVLPSNDDDISILPVSYKEYVLFNDFGEFNIVGYTGSTKYNEYITISVEGEGFPSLSATTFGSFSYHLKPKQVHIEKFFSGLDEFQSNLLDRFKIPQYTSTFEIPTETSTGNIIYTNKTITWPTSDGYNLDYEGIPYSKYLKELIGIGKVFDKYKTNLISRFFVTESIHEFDTEGGGDESTGRKINKLLKIYGREFDEVKKYADSISFAYTFTYNKKDNAPDEY